MGFGLVGVLGLIGFVCIQIAHTFQIDALEKRVKKLEEGVDP